MCVFVDYFNSTQVQEEIPVDATTLITTLERLCNHPSTNLFLSLNQAFGTPEVFGVSGCETITEH